jgi:hypothetical protein
MFLALAILAATAADAFAALGTASCGQGAFVFAKCNKATTITVPVGGPTAGVVGIGSYFTPGALTYANGASCTWVLSAATRTAHIVFWFTMLDMEEGLGGA